MTTPAKPPGLLARLLALFRRPARPRPVEAMPDPATTALCEHMNVVLGIGYAELAKRREALKNGAKTTPHTGRTREILAVLEAGPLTRREILARLPSPPSLSCVSSLLNSAMQAGHVRRVPGQRWALTKVEAEFRLEADR